MRLQGTHQSVGEIDHKHGEIRTIVHGRLLHRLEIFQAPILFGITKIELQLETQTIIVYQLIIRKVQVTAPPAFHNRLSRGLLPGATPAALPYPMRRRLSSTSESRAAPRSAWLQAASAGWGGARGGTQEPEVQEGPRQGMRRRAQPAGRRTKCLQLPLRTRLTP